MPVENQIYDRREQRAVNATQKRLLHGRTFTREALLANQEKVVRLGDQISLDRIPRQKILNTTVVQELNVDLEEVPGSNGQVWRCDVDEATFFEDIGAHFVLGEGFPIVLRGRKTGESTFFTIDATYVPPTAVEPQTFEISYNFDHGEVVFSDAPTDLDALRIDFHRYRPSAFQGGVGVGTGTLAVARDIIIDPLPAFEPYTMPGGLTYDDAVDFSTNTQVYLNGQLLFNASQAYDVFGDDGVSDVFAALNSPSSVIKFSSTLEPGDRITVFDADGGSLGASLVGRTILSTPVTAGQALAMPLGIFYEDPFDFEEGILVYLNGLLLHSAPGAVGAWLDSEPIPDGVSDVFAASLTTSGSVKFAIDLVAGDRLQFLRL